MSNRYIEVCVVTTDTGGIQEGKRGVIRMRDKLSRFIASICCISPTDLIASSIVYEDSNRDFLLSFFYSFNTFIIPFLFSFPLSEEILLLSRTNIDNDMSITTLRE